MILPNKVTRELTILASADENTIKDQLEAAIAIYLSLRRISQKDCDTILARLQNEN